MLKKTKIILLSLTLILLVFLIWMHYRNTHSHLETEEGPHGGRVFLNDGITTEIKIKEQGKSAYFYVYLSQNKKTLDPKRAHLILTLKRFNDEKDVVTFEPVEDYLKSKEEIREPHSFDVNANLTIDGKNIEWNYENINGRITLGPETIKSTGIKLATAGPAIIEKKLTVIGKITPNQNALSSIYPRFAGIVKEMKKNLGDSVETGETLAIVESNESLRAYPINAPITGTIVQKNVIVGEMVKEDKVIYQIADLSTVWADLTLYRKEAVLIKNGMPTVVVGDNGHPKQTGIINYISPLGIEDSQTILARSFLNNQNHEWVPGMYVNATITYLDKSVPVAVALSAIQQLHGAPVVFVNRNNTFEATPIEIGVQNENEAEVITGLKAGQMYVTDNSFLLKAELGKSQIEHDD